MPDYTKLKVADLKKLLKEKAQSGAGEKEELVTRLKLCDAGEMHTLPDVSEADAKGLANELAVEEKHEKRFQSEM